LFGSLALIADGIHLGTHCIAFFITAFAYSYSRRHQHNPYYVFGTGKVGELASFTSALILMVVSFIIMYGGISRFIAPENIDYLQALPVSFVGLFVNVSSVFLLSCKCRKSKNTTTSSTDNAGRNDDEDAMFEMSHGHTHGHAAEHYEYNLMDDDEEAQNQGHDHGHDHKHVCDNDHGHDHKQVSDHDHGHDHRQVSDHDHGLDHDETFHIQVIII
jgi:hypothetical protein